MPRHLAVSALCLGFAGAAQAETITGPSGSYGLLEYRVAGNSAFFDPFEDGSLTGAPTSYFTPLAGSVLAEGDGPGGIGRPATEGQLVLTAADGADDLLVFAGAGDFAFLGQPLVDSEGDATITATYRAQAPEPGELFGVGIGESDTYLPSALLVVSTLGDDVSGLPPACAVPNSLLVRWYDRFLELGCDVFQLQDATGAFVLRIGVNDATGYASASYSIDGGVQFADGAAWDVPAAPSQVWIYGTSIYSSVFAGYAVPEPGAGALAAAAGIALAALARRR